MPHGGRDKKTGKLRSVPVMSGCPGQARVTTASSRGYHPTLGCFWFMAADPPLPDPESDETEAYGNKMLGAFSENSLLIAKSYND